MKPKILFILKRRADYNGEIHSQLNMSTGLYNSVKFMNDMLYENYIDSVVEVAIDNNCIDRLVTLHKPTHVIIEALWVVPSKFAVLTRLHPNVKWMIRLHSETPFLAEEGIAFDWVGEYAKYNNVSIAVNAEQMGRDVRAMLGAMGIKDHHKVVYLPNYYPEDFRHKRFDRNKDTVDVCCFGAIRPLKNHMTQAVAAVKFARKIGKKLNFHINATRVEGRGDSCLRNIQGMFAHLGEHGYRLIGHGWAPHEEFLDICHEMDIGLQVSFSETFNIVAADLISQGVPIVASKEIPWASRLFLADPTDSDNIAAVMERTYRYAKTNVWKNKQNLSKYISSTESTWLKHFRNM